MKVRIAEEAARRETQIFRKNSFHVMKYTPNRNGKSEIKCKSTKYFSSGSQQTFSKPTELKSQIIYASVVEEFDIRGRAADLEKSYAIHVTPNTILLKFVRKINYI